VFCEKKNLSVRRKIFKVWKRKKKCKCRISGVRKKNEIERKKRKVPRKKMVKILLSSCSLVNFKLKLWEKNGENFQSIFRVGFLELKLQFAEKGKVKENVGVVDVPLVGRHVD
jgi:hypothetical protein